MPELPDIFKSGKCATILLFEGAKNIGLIWVDKMSNHRLHHLTIKNLLKSIDCGLRFSFLFLKLLECIYYQKYYTKSEVSDYGFLK